MGVQLCWGTLPWQPIFGTQFAVTGFVGYNFGCMIASDTLFDSRGWFFGVMLSDEDIAGINCLRVVTMATNFGTKIAINCFVWTIATRQLVTVGVWMVGWQMQMLPIPVPKGCSYGNHFLAFYIWGAHWRHWRIRLHLACAAVMRPYVKLLQPLVQLISALLTVINAVNGCSYSMHCGIFCFLLGWTK